MQTDAQGETGSENIAPSPEDAGVVNVYSARHYDVDDSVYESFTEQTGIRVNLIEGSSDELIARLEQEGDLSNADVFITVDVGRLWRAEKRGFFTEVNSETLNERVPESLRHPDGLWFGLTKRIRVIAASVDRIQEDKAFDYEDLADAQWRDRVLVRSSSNIYNQSLVASMIETMGASATEAWCEGLVANFARTPQGGDSDQIRGIAAGEGDLAIVNHYYYARMLSGNETDKAVAELVRLVFPNQNGRGAHVNISGAGVLEHAPNRQNAIRFIEYLLNDESQRAFASASLEFPVARGVEAEPVLQGLGQFKEDPINASVLGRNNREAMEIMDRAGWR